MSAGGGRLGFFFCTICLPVLISAQEAEIPSSELRLDEFRLSGPPALALLGISASSVSRPNTPRALIASLVSATGSSGLVPNGYAMETSPYWLLKHPALTLKDYHRASLGDRLRYFTAFSAATSRSSVSESAPDDARVSIAARTLLLNGRPNGALLATLDSMRAAQLVYIRRYRTLETVKPNAAGLAAARDRLERQEALLSTLVTKVLVGPDRELRDSTLRTLARRDSARSQVAAIERAEKSVADLERQLETAEGRLSRFAADIGNMEAEPDGLTLELALGWRAQFIAGEWDRARSDGVGVWFTPMYRAPSSDLEVIGVARYLTRVAEYGGGELLDLGARAGWEIGKAALSAEWVRRGVSGGRTSSRWAGIFDYNLPANLHLVASFGSDFRRRDGKRPVIATLGINLGVGSIMLLPGSNSKMGN